jgi:hypothetical protein
LPNGGASRCQLLYLLGLALLNFGGSSVLLNRTAFHLALAGLLVVFLGPLLFAKLRHEGTNGS